MLDDVHFPTLTKLAITHVADYTKISCTVGVHSSPVQVMVHQYMVHDGDVVIKEYYYYCCTKSTHTWTHSLVP